MENDFQNTEKCNVQKSEDYDVQRSEKYPENYDVQRSEKYLEKYLEKYSEIAILFSPEYKHLVESINDTLTGLFPEKEVYLVPSKSILCSAKCDRYESYVLVGIECPLHKFENCVQYKIDQIEFDVRDYKGRIFLDSIYTNNINDNKNININDSNNINNTNININDISINNNMDESAMILTNNQAVLDYYSTIYENIGTPFKNLNIKTKVQHLMKEYSNASKLKNKKMVGVVFTSRVFEDLASSIVNKINQFSRAYKILLKDVSYERMISIDNIDCIVLVDCPLFEFKESIHVPVISPFSVEHFIKESSTKDSGSTEEQIPTRQEESLVLHSSAVEIMENRWFKGVIFTGEEDMKIYQGRKGIATSYENEGQNTEKEDG